MNSWGRILSHLGSKSSLFWDLSVDLAQSPERKEKKPAPSLWIHTLNPLFKIDSSPNLPIATSEGKVQRLRKYPSAKELEKTAKATSNTNAIIVNVWQSKSSRQEKYLLIKTSPNDARRMSRPGEESTFHHHFMTSSPTRWASMAQTGPWIRTFGSAKNCN